MTDNNKTFADQNTELNNDDVEMYELFSAFDSVSASDDLQQRALGAIFQTLDEQTGAEGSAAEEAKLKESVNTEQISEESAIVNQAEAEESAAAKLVPEGTHPQEDARSLRVSKKARWRIIRSVAIAACLAFVCFGGAAWALPAAHITVASNAGTVELAVNRFGHTLEVTAENEDTQQALNSAQVTNKNYEDSLDSLLNILSVDEEQDIQIQVESSDTHIRENMEQRSNEMLKRKGMGPKETPTLNDPAPETTALPSQEAAPNVESAPQQGPSQDTVGFENQLPHTSTPAPNPANEPAQQFNQPESMQQPLQSQESENAPQPNAGPSEQQPGLGTSAQGFAPPEMPDTSNNQPAFPQGEQGQAF